MKPGGIVRKVDTLGRIVIPIEMRRALSIEVQDPLEIMQVGDDIVIHKPQTSCAICGSTEHITTIGQKFICSDCIKRVKEEF